MSIITSSVFFFVFRLADKLVTEPVVDNRSNVTRRICANLMIKKKRLTLKNSGKGSIVFCSFLVNSIKARNSCCYNIRFPRRDLSDIVKGWVEIF